MRRARQVETLEERPFQVRNGMNIACSQIHSGELVVDHSKSFRRIGGHHSYSHVEFGRIGGNIHKASDPSLNVWRWETQRVLVCNFEVPSALEVEGIQALPISLIILIYFF